MAEKFKQEANETDENEEDDEVLEETQETTQVDDESDSDEVSTSDSSEQIADDKLPFPRATITKLVRKSVSKGKQIKGTVKDEMNLWVNNLVEKIVKKMNSQPYTFVNYDMLRDSVAPYEDMQGINKQREDLIKKIESIRVECDLVINAVDSETKAKALSLKLDVEDLPFPKATITNKIRKHLGNDKTIKGPVKRGLNIWLGTMVERVSKKMDSYPYPYIDRSMFKEAIEPYEAVSEIELEKERIIQQMQSMKIVCDLLKMEIERKFKL